jgi:hypothetical protein
MTIYQKMVAVQGLRLRPSHSDVYDLFHIIIIIITTAAATTTTVPVPYGATVLEKLDLPTTTTTANTTTTTAANTTLLLR